MRRKYLKNNWRKLDNTAKIFSLDSEKNANTFRYSIILKEPVDKLILEQALDESLNYFQAFKVKMGTGLFWNYFEYNAKPIIIEEEKGIACRHITLKKNNDYLFKITYYKNKINLDILHALTDGKGAIEFLKVIIYNYLDIKHNIRTIENKKTYEIKYNDQYVEKYDKNLGETPKTPKAYQLETKSIPNVNNTYHYTVDIVELKKVCKEYHVTITEYLTALYIYALYLSLYEKKSKKEIIITVPINLRNYYEVDTLSNFFVCMDINPKIVEKKITTFEEIVKQVHQEFQDKLTADTIKNYLARDVKLGKNIPIRLVPLVIKKFFIKHLGSLLGNPTTSTVSNVGNVTIEEQYKEYIENVLVLVMPGRSQKIKCTICSFDTKLNVTLNSNIDDLDFEKCFFKLLQNKINMVEISGNNFINE